MKRVKVTIPGKVIVSGEHAVVYYEPALVASIDKVMTVTVETADHFKLVSEVADRLELVPEALRQAGVEPDRVKVTIESEIPAGMGTSAAICAGVIKAAYDYQGKALNQDEWYQLAWEGEKKAHGNSSGVDPAAVIYGGLLWYVRGKEHRHFKSARPYTFVLVDSGQPEESTGEMVLGLAERVKAHKAKYKVGVERIGEVTKKMKESMIKGEEIANLIDDNGKLLEELGLVGKKAIKMSEGLRAKGYGVKITGAGGVKAGSGRLLVAGASLAAVKALGYDAFAVTIGGV